MLVIADVAVAVTAAIALTVRLAGDDPGSASPKRQAAPSTVASSPAAPSVAPALISWVRHNVPSSATIVAEGAAAASLEGIGFRTSTDYTNCRSDRFLLVTKSLRHRAAALPALARCLASSQLVAAVGQGASTAQLRTLAADPDAAEMARQHALADRRLGGTALTRNPKLTMPVEVRQELLAGHLDLRAETVLVTLARRTPFRIDSVHSDPAEARAGMPARTVLLRLADPPDAGWFLTHLSSNYRPSSIVPRGPTTERLTWSFLIEPPPVLK